MGLFDDVHVEMDLPPAPVAPPSRDFQTKDMGETMTHFRVDPEGRLWREEIERERDPEAEQQARDQGDAFPFLRGWRTISRKWVPDVFSGAVRIYTTNFPDTGDWEYLVLFDRGRALEVHLVEFRPPTGRTQETMQTATCPESVRYDLPPRVAGVDEMPGLALPRRDIAADLDWWAAHGRDYGGDALASEIGTVVATLEALLAPERDETEAQDLLEKLRAVRAKACESKDQDQPVDQQ